MKKILLLTSLTILTSCGGDWYLETAPKQSTYIEEPKSGSLSGALSSTSETVQIVGEPDVFETKGQGLNLGLTYQSTLIHQKFQYYQNTYDEINYTYSVNGGSLQKAEINLETAGFSYLLGMRIGNFVPRVGLRSENQTVNTKVDGVLQDTPEKTGQLFLGYGLEFRLPVTQSIEVFGSWDRSLKVSKDPNFRIRNDEIAVGFNYNPFANSGGTKVRPNESILPYWRLY